MLGLWYAISRRRWRIGLVICLVGLAAAVVATGVIVPHYAPGGGSPFAGRYAAVGGSPAGIVRTLFTHPERIAQAATSAADLRYLRDLLVPLTGLPLLAPALAVVALPELVLNLLSSTRTQTSVQFHYTAVVIPVFVAASVFGAVRVQRAWPGSLRALTRAVVVVALLSGVLLGPLPIWSHVPFGSTRATRDHVVTRHDRIAAEAVALVPPGAPVTATNTLGAHLSARRRIFSFPVVRDASWVVVDTTRPSYRDQAVAPERFAAAYERLRADRRWKVVFDRDGILVLRR
jgi:uncharacterized membrane protein